MGSTPVRSRHFGRHVVLAYRFCLETSNLDRIPIDPLEQPLEQPYYLMESLLSVFPWWRMSVIRPYLRYLFSCGESRINCGVTTYRRPATGGKAASCAAKAGWHDMQIDFGSDS